jgi:para-aminobenzoate synthetase/4-amino-4-deoxychorismate lyase
MAWIARLETTPRGVYCGAIGWVAPGERARFAVGIRTAEIDLQGSVAYGVGGGIVWDSEAEAEWRECLVKARALAETPPGDLGLFETLLWRGAAGAPLAARHLARLADSADLLGLACPAPAELEGLLAAATAALPAGPHRVRLELGVGGAVGVRAEPFHRRREPWRLRLAGEPVDPDDRLLFHKTTRRDPYDAALAAARAGGADEALLENRAGELTEGARTNLVVEVDGRRVTPHWECGLLPGILRGRLLEAGRLREARVTRDELARASRVWAINALRGATRVAAVDDRDGRPLWSAS